MIPGTSFNNIFSAVDDGYSLNGVKPPVDNAAGRGRAVRTLGVHCGVSAYFSGSELADDMLLTLYIISCLRHPHGASPYSNCSTVFGIEEARAKYSQR